MVRKGRKELGAHIFTFLMIGTILFLSGVLVWAASDGEEVNGHTVSVSLSKTLVAIGTQVTANASCTCNENAEDPHALAWTSLTPLEVDDNDGSDGAISAKGTPETTGTFTIRASCNGATDSEELEVIGITSITATDSQHAGRVATEGQTLHLVGHNDAAIAVQGVFSESDQPRWSGGTPPPTNGMRNFSAKAPIDETFIASVLEQSVSVTVNRHQKNKQDITSPAWDITGLNDDLKKNLKFKGANATLRVILPEVSASASRENAEVKNSPNYGTQYNVSGSVTGFGLEGRITHPAYSGSFDDPYITGIEALWELYGQASGELSASAGLKKPPEDNWQADDATLKATLKFEVGYYVVVESDWGLYGEGTLNANTSVSGTAKFEDSKIKGKASWGGINANAKLTIQDKDTPPTTYITIGGQIQLVDGSATEWYELYDVSGLGESN